MALFSEELVELELSLVRNIIFLSGSIIIGTGKPQSMSPDNESECGEALSPSVRPSVHPFAHR